jgi:hypothetical protein
MPKSYHRRQFSNPKARHTVIRLVYVSTCVNGLHLQDVHSIVASAQARNEKQGISGMLCWSGEFFLQCLEGERDRVTQCFGKIMNDARHHSVELIVSSPTSARWFSEWGMGFSRLMSSHRLDVDSLAGQAFNPYLLQATEMQSTFSQLSQHAQRLRL